MWYKNIAGRFFGLVTKHACDRRADRQTDRRTDRITTHKTALAQLRRAVKNQFGGRKVVGHAMLAHWVQLKSGRGDCWPCPIRFAANQRLVRLAERRYIVGLQTAIFIQASPKNFGMAPLYTFWLWAYYKILIFSDITMDTCFVISFILLNYRSSKTVRFLFRIGTFIDTFTQKTKLLGVKLRIKP